MNKQRRLLRKSLVLFVASALFISALLATSVESSSHAAAQQAQREQGDQPQEDQDQEPSSQNGQEQSDQQSRDQGDQNSGEQSEDPDPPEQVSAQQQAASPPIANLSSTGCTDGTFVDLTANPRVDGDNNDLAEDCQVLVAAQNHWAALSSNNDLPLNHPLRTWGTGSASEKKIGNWTGITVLDKRIDRVNLRPDASTIRGKIEGSIPTQLGNLSKLRYLILAENKLSGNIPTQLGNLTNLEYLNLWNNSGLTGSIPTELGNLTKLKGLDLGTLRLSGSIPTQLGNLTNLEYLNLWGNSGITGSIPTELGNLTKLTGLDLGFNQLTGSIPTELGNLTKLTGLTLNGNQLTGSIPTQFGNLTKLRDIYLGFNQLTGSIPTELGNLTKLTELHLNGNELTGGIPTELGNLTKLTGLYLDGNELTGGIPTQFGNLTKLTNINLGFNRLTGSIPTELGNLTELTYLNLENNRLSGSIPTELGNLTKLTNLNLKNNRLSGSIPTELGNLTKLTNLNLENNRLSGSIPTELGNLAGSLNLRTVHICNNYFTGSVPESLRTALLEDYPVASGYDPVACQIASDIVFDAPKQKIGSGNSKTFDAGSFAEDGEYEISCGNASSVDAKFTSVTRQGTTCLFVVVAGSTQGDASFTVLYTSNGGDTHSGTITVAIGSSSSIRFTAPTGLKLFAGLAKDIDATSYVQDGIYTFTCADAASVSTKFSSVTRTANTCNFKASAKAAATAGAASFTVPYTSEGGDTHDGVITLTIEPNIAYTAPTSLSVIANTSITIDAAAYASHSSYTISCSDHTAKDAKITTIARNGCDYTATAGSTTGTADFTIVYTSSGGGRITATIPITIAAVSSITYTPPTDLKVAAGNSLAINAASYASDGAYTITCADATSISSQFTSVTRTANTCNYSAIAKATAAAGAASFTVPYTSSGGDTHNGVVSITITAISYTAPTDLKVVAGSNTDINVSSWATHTGYTVTCGDAKSVHAKLTSVTRTANTCNYRITAKAAATAGDATFTIPYASSSGATLDAQVTVKVSNIAFTAPNNLTMAAGETLAISAGGYASDGTFTITCADATNISNQFTSVSRTANTCNYSAIAKATASAGSASFTVPYTSSGGDTHNGVISITITAISYTAPTDLKVVAGASTDVTASSWATHSGYTISCGDAKSVHAKLASVTRPDADAKPCEYRIAAKAAATAGDATFTIPYTSSSGATLDAQVTVKVSNIAYTAPTDLTMAAGETLAISAGGYATDGTFTITCADATNISNQFTSVSRTANTCNYSAIAKATATAGAATFTVPYTSSGGDTHNGVISITITVISYTAPTDLKVVAGASTDVTASSWATHSGYTISCGNAKSIHAKLTSVTRTANTCNYRITAKATATAGDATFTIPYASTSGATLDAQVTVKVSNIAFTAPNNLTMAAGETLAVSAGGYASDGTFSISCADATSISTEFSSVRRTANTCSYSVIAKATASAGSATFTVPYTSSGGDTHNGQISITITAISYTAPTDLKVVAGANTDITASSWATHTGYTVSCGDAKSVHAKLSSVTRTANTCNYRITAKTTASAGDATFTIPYTSTSGATLDAQVTVKVSNIAFTAPTTLSMAAGETLAISAGSYASDGTFTITCADATSISNQFTSVSRTANSCNYSAVAKPTASAGSASFTVPYTSSGGDTQNGQISITISIISYTAPTNLKVVAGASSDINASSWASHTGYTVSCGDAKSLHAKLSSVTRPDAATKPCEYRVTAKAAATAGDATFTIPYTSTSGATLDAQVTVKVSNIAYTAPTTLTMAAGETLAVNAGGYATDGTFTITCADATSISNQFTSVSRTANTCNYSVIAKATASAGSATFTVPYTSSGGDTHNGQISITITAISYTAPTDLKVVAGANTDINASSWATHTGYTISCGDAKNIHAKLTSVTRPNAATKPCEYRVTAKAAATAGDATFTIPYTSTSGATLDATVTVKVSNIAFTAPNNLTMAAGETLAVSAASYASDGAFTITCADATSISNQFTSVSRTVNTCNYSAVAKATASAGSASFTVPYTSSGGDTQNGVISITISAISYTAPTDLKVVAGANTDINASGWASHTGYTVSCGDAKSVHAKLTSVTRTANTCNYRITAKAAATAGDATFTIPYTSTSGATLDAQVTVKVSNIAYTAPNNLTMAAGETLAISAASYASDGAFTITCADATNISTEFTSVSRTANTCNYSAVAKATASAGAATFTVPYTSSGGDTHNGVISITITAISYTAPNNLKVVAGSNADINASSWASHTGYTISCGDAKSIHTKLTSVTRPDAANKPCKYRVTAKTTSTAGDATFTIPYTSTSGATLDAQVTIKVSNIAFTAPNNLTMAAGETLAISAASYATDGTFTITCADATSISNQFTSVTRTANSCNYSAVAKPTASAGSATFTVPYTSSGGDTHNGQISITITAISYTAPQNLKVVAGANTDINASTWASHTGYTITCGDAKSIHAKLISVTRTANTCNYRITAKAAATAGDATFTIPYASSSGATLDAQVTVKVSNIAFTAPALSMAAGETLAVSAGGYASDGTFTISCADATSISAQFSSVSRTANTCNYSAVAKATASAGSASFTVPYTSSGGDTQNGVISITISAISYTAPTDLKIVAGANTDINASSWASHTGYTVSCGAAKSIHAKLTSVTRPNAATKPCEYRITAKAAATAGNATFTIPYTSTSGATLDAQVTVKVSNIAFTAPTNLTMAAGETLAVSAGAYATDGAFTITCADATSISAQFTSVSRTANTCNYSAAAKATASAGSASFTVPYTSSGGDTHNGVISITITAISYTAPQNLKVVAGANTDINASTWASHTGYTITCGDAKSIHAKLISVTRIANTCNYRITAKATVTAGDATFTIPYTSTSGATLDAQVTVKVSNIAYTAPTNLTMAAGETLAVSAGGYASDGTFTVTCADATNISSQFTSVSRTANSCNYSAVAKATASAGAASFTVPYTSSGGDTQNGQISITISTISYTAPSDLKVVAGANTDINASSWATHTSYTISCGDAKSIHAKLTSVTRPDAATKPCEYRITAKATATAGDATFTIPYTSTSGATLDAQVTIKVSNIAFTAPNNLTMAAGETLAISAASYATDGTFTISCADATSISTEFSSVSRTANTCNYSVIAEATASAGSASFTVPYTSSGGDIHNGQISITISSISYTAPTDLKVVAGSNTDVTASSWATHSGYTISCGDAKSIHAKLTSVTRPDAANKPCEYRVAAKAAATAGDATFTIPYTSTSGATLDAQVTVKVSKIAFTAPTTLSMAAGETLAISAGNYATDGTFTITCAEATSISNQFTSVTRTANTCNYSAIAKATASAGFASFTVPYTSSGGDTHNGQISITITAISYTAPTDLKVVAGSNTDITASSWASHTGYTVSCGAAKSIHAKLSSVTRPNAATKPCEYRVTAKAASTAGDATFTIPYTSTSGATLDAQVTVQVSNIAYTAPNNLTMAAGETLAVTASSYATDGTFTITCANATSISAQFTSVTRTTNTCNYSVIAKATASAGAASFTVPYTSSGGDTHNGQISITISAISYTAPTDLKVVAGSNTDITASGWASHSGYTISCGDAKSIHAKLTSVTRLDAATKPCEYRITAKTTATAGDATFTIPYTSTSGATLDAQVTVKVSNIAYTAPTNLTMAAGETLAISASSYASDGTFTITCADATSISNQFTSVSRTANTCNYSAAAKTTASAGSASFTVPYTSSGGDTHNGVISITITAISYTAPTDLKVVAGSSADINASSWASHSSYTITCGAAKSVHAKLTSVTRPNAATKPCEYRITAKAAATAGDATFIIPYSSTSGATLDAQVTIKVSNIAFTAPTTLSMAAGETLAVSAGGYASDGTFTITCADATSISNQFTSVTRTANTCNYSVIAKATASAGSASFTVPYTSTGGDTHNGVISVTISTIAYTAPTGLKVVAGSNTDITASSWATHTGYTVSCGDAKSIHSKLTSVTRTANTCNYRITAKATATAGDATFTIPYTSTSGATLDAQVTVKVSNIAYTAPNNLTMAAGETLAVSAASYVSDGTFTITCADATSISNQFTSVSRTVNTCNYSAVAKPTASAGSASFTVPYTSTGGDTQNGQISITISTISYTAPTNLKVVAGANTDINASSWATHTGYTVSCGAAKSLHAKLSSVTRPNAATKPCEYKITAKAAATAGNATFTIPYTSSSGATLDAQVTVKVSNIAFTAPTNLTMAAGETLAISAGGYATDGTFTITCSDATSISAQFTSVSRTANSCNYSAVAKPTASAGSASFTVPYTSSGGDTQNGVISITISAISYTAPTDLKVVAGASSDINASSWASHTGYTVSCGDAKSVHAKLSSVTRTANTCNYRITAKAAATAGDATFTIPYTSTSGATLDATVTVKVSNIAYTAPTNLTMAAGETLAVSAASYASDGTFTISCADATSISNQFTSVSRTVNTCNYSAIAKATASAGAATFTIPYTSTGGDTQNGVISITITSISYTAATDLKVVAGANTDINASSWATHTGYTISCGDAKSIHAKLTSVTRPNAATKPCEYRITAKAAATAGNATFTIPYTSTSGATLDAQVTVKVSNIAFTAPNNLTMAAGETLAVSAASYASDGTFTITCADATSISNQFSLVTRTANTCNYSAVAKETASAGTATFTVPYTSSGGDTHNGQISITVTAISYIAPTDLKVVAGANTDINASSWASHTGYTVSCGDAKSVHAKLTSVTRTANTCNYRITAKTTASAGDATFIIPYSSTSGATLDAQVTVKVSNIAYTAPNNLTMAAGETLAISAASYASDGTFTITCANATNISNQFTSVSRTANTCNYSAAAKTTASAGSATFTVPYTSTGGDTHSGVISITITAISFSPPDDLEVFIGQSIVVDAASYATHSGFVISCSDAENVDSKISDIAREECIYTITAGEETGAASFTVPYSSSSGDTLGGGIPLTIISPQPNNMENPQDDPGNDPSPRTPLPPPNPPSSEAPPASATRPDSTDYIGLRWNFFAVQQGGTELSDIRTQLTPSTHPGIWTWSMNAQAWQRIYDTASALPAGTLVVFRTTTEPNPDTLASLNLGNTIQTTLQPGWNILSVPISLMRPETGTFLIDELLLRCDADTQAAIIANYQTRQEAWYIWLPCYQRTETLYTTGPEAMYKPLAQIVQTQPIYLCLTSLTPIQITWNPNTQRYETQDQTQSISTDTPQTSLTTNTCSK